MLNDRENLSGTTMSQEQLQEELRRLYEQLEDVEAEELAWLQQTGHHIGRRVFQSRRRELEADRKSLKERIEYIYLMLQPSS